MLQIFISNSPFLHISVIDIHHPVIQTSDLRMGKQIQRSDKLQPTRSFEKSQP